MEVIGVLEDAFGHIGDFCLEFVLGIESIDNGLSLIHSAFAIFISVALKEQCFCDPLSKLSDLELVLINVAITIFIISELDGSGGEAEEGKGSESLHRYLVCVFFIIINFAKSRP